MRVLFVNRYFRPDVSGNSRMLTDLAADLSGAGHRVSVIASDAASDDPSARYPKQEANEGVRIHRVPASRFDRGTIPGWVLNSLFFYPSALNAAIRLPRHDLIIFMSDPPLLFALGPVLRFLKGSRYVTWCQDLYPEVAIRLGILGGRSLPAIILEAISRRALRSADGVIAVGEFMAEILRQKGIDPGKIRVIPNWADGERVRPIEPDSNRFLDAHDLRKRFIVLYSGNLGLGHDIEMVMKAAVRLKEEKEILFLFIGGGKKYGPLRERSAGLTNIRFLPYQDDRDLACSLSSGDLHLVTLQPGLEGIVVPSKLYGALAAGRAVIYIGSAQSEAARIIEEAGCGFVIAPNDDEGFCRAVLELYRLPERRRLLGDRARKVFESQFDRPAAARKFESALRGVLETDRPVSRMKRLFDIALSGAGLIGSSPLWALFAVWVKLSDGGPVFYQQERAGKDGRNFFALKFRSMIPNAEAGLGPVQAGYDDPRVTRVGRFLRATAMDELPQLWNIFIGDMSFVGPRALRPVEIEIKNVRDENVPNFHLRHRVQPGLTGLAQIYAPRDASRRNKLRYDLLYARSRSFGLDLKLIALSFWITFRGRWETRGKKI
ncbi:MAG: sugar transferase [Nitrospirae bacterium]|nr:sugar transferase [Nitrospirota bacterium]